MPANADRYYYETRKAAAAAMAKGHSDREALRELLIWTTSRTTAEMVYDYFRRHLDDRRLLSDLIAIALEGEDNGDAPWAAANVIAEFHGELVARDRARTQKAKQ